MLDLEIKDEIKIIGETGLKGFKIGEIYKLIKIGNLKGGIFYRFRSSRIGSSLTCAYYAYQIEKLVKENLIEIL